MKSDFSAPLSLVLMLVVRGAVFGALEWTTMSRARRWAGGPGLWLHPSFGPEDEVGKRGRQLLRGERAVAVSVRAPGDKALDQAVGIAGRGVRGEVESRGHGIPKCGKRERKDRQITLGRVVVLDVVEPRARDREALRVDPLESGRVEAARSGAERAVDHVVGQGGTASPSVAAKARNDENA